MEREHVTTLIGDAEQTNRVLEEKVAYYEAMVTQLEKSPVTSSSSDFDMKVSIVLR